jgi:hypothetical protein
MRTAHQLGRSALERELVTASTVRGYDVALWAAVLLGIALRTAQYVGAGSLSLDEVALARGILDLDLVALLTQPLPHAQVAPKGFLLLQKLASQWLGASDHALRLVPFLASLAALLAFRKVALHALDGAGPLIATTVFALAPSLITYGSTLKQYASDVCISALLLWLVLASITRPPTALRRSVAAAAGMAAVWLSQPALLVLASLGAAWLWISRAQPAHARNAGAWLPVWLLWAVSAGAAAWASEASIPTDVMALMTGFWKEGYPPVPFDSPLDLFWPIGRIYSLYGSSNPASFGYPARAIFLALTALGGYALWRHHRRTALVLLAPLLAALAAAWLRLYPFSGRLILFLVPVFVLALAAGVEWLRRQAGARAPRLGNALAAALVLTAIAPVALRPPPYAREDVAPLLAHLRDQRRPGDAIYVYYDVAPAVSFYAERYGLGADDYAVGGCHRQQSRTYLAELDTFRGRPRLWLVVTHASRPHEGQELIDYLDALGVRLDHFASRSRMVDGPPRPAEAILYDLSDAQRLESVRADGFALRGSGDWRHTPCKGPLAMIESEFKGIGAAPGR